MWADRRRVGVGNGPPICHAWLAIDGPITMGLRLMGGGNGE